MAVPENYRLLKLKNGDDLISECFESPEDKKHLVLIRPMQIRIAVGFDRSGNPVPSKLIMTEWLAFSQEDTVALPRENILSIGKPTEQIAAVYDKEKLRIAELRSKLELKGIPVNPLEEEKTSEKIESEKARKRKINKRKKMILIQMSVETLMRMLESLGLDIDDDPWKAMLNPPDDDDDDDEDDDDDDEEESNIDGSLDLRPDVDGDGLVDPYGNRSPEN